MKVKYQEPIFDRLSLSCLLDIQGVMAPKDSGKRTHPRTKSRGTPSLEIKINRKMGKREKGRERTGEECEKN